LDGEHDGIFLLIVDLFVGELLVFLGRRGKVDDSEPEKGYTVVHICARKTS